MAEKAKCTPCIEKKVTALIANSQGRLAEDDREWLQTLEEVQLDKLDVPVVTTNKAAEPEEKKPATVISALTEDQKADLAWAQSERKARKAARIESIQTNTSKEAWPDEVLNAMSEDLLERLVNSTKKEQPANYAAMGGGPVRTNASGIKPMAPMGVEFEN